MVSGRRLLAALGLLLATAAGAQGYDPRHQWRTLETARFRIHYHEGLEPLAQRAARAFERAHAALAPAMGHEPAGPVEVVLSDDTDDANGSAEVVPRNVVRLFAVAPASGSVLDDYGDWLDTVVFHEYVHILHLDDVSGLPRFLNAIFGKILSPSGLGPPWITEGVAVLHESEPGAGRNHSALFDAWARALALEGGLPDLPVVSSLPLDWPRGNLWYLLGGRFLEFLVQRNGEEALRAFLVEQGSELWPYLMNTLAERHFGASFDTLWAEFGARLRDRYRAQVAALPAPVTAPTFLTRRGALVAGPRFAPDGAWVAYRDQGLHQRAGLRRAGLDGRDLGLLALADGNGSFALAGGGAAVVALTDVLEEYRQVDDLWVVGLPDGGRRRLTSGERATDPDVPPGGATAVYVAHLPGGGHALRRIRLEGGAPETLLARAGTELFRPRVSPDGRRVALEVQEGGRRDVAILDGEELAFVTDDDALDQAPAWSPDGRVLYFSSDRSGIFNVYAFELDSAPTATSTSTPTSSTPPRPLVPGRLRQVTNVASLALQPDVSPDGRTLAFVGYSRAGYDLATAPLDPATWREPPDPDLRPARHLGAPDPVGPLPSRPYRPLDTLGPAWWLPTFASDAGGAAVGALSAGSDVALRHAWAASGQWGLRSRQASYDLAYAAGWLGPTLTLGTRRLVGSTPDTPSRLEVQWVPLDAQLTFSRSGAESVQAIALGWRGLLFRPLEAADPLDPAPYRGATASELNLGLAYGSARRFGYSISREEGGLLALRLRLASPDLGGDQAYASARLSGSTYLRIPGTRHAVAALHASMGVATGTIVGRQPFEIGGLSSSDLSTIVGGLVGGSFPAQADQLRGYPQGAFSGTTLFSGTAELRFPLADLSAGHSTWPALLRRLHGALFLDTGAAFRPGDGPQGRGLGDLRRLRFGAGGELILEVVLGYQLPLDLRLGLARGLGPLLAASPKPADPLAETQVYLTVGEPF